MYQGFLRIEHELPDDKLYYLLGTMNLQGLGTDKNLERAEEYFTKAAILGNVDAVYGMGKLHLETDPEKAILLSNICSLRMSSPQDNYPPVVLVLDECQLLNWGQDSYIKQIMSRGRKYALAAWLSTQFIADKNMANSIEQADLRLYFKPTTEEIKKIAQRLSIGTKLKKQCEATLDTLKRGQFICKLDDQVRLSAPPLNP